uniref:Uncharacterized protein n=1 Tax=Panagrolaimus sp. JU765 TaxID=591449 RepID=A0AC34R1Y7_9BILA
MPRPRLLHRSNKSSHQKRGTNSTNKNNNLLKYSSVTPQQNSRDENDNISDLSSDAANPDYYQQNNSTTKANELQTKIKNFKQFFGGTFSEIFNGKIIKRILTMIILAITCSAIIRFTLVLDLDKTVPKHEPGSCKIIQDFKKTPGGKSGYLEYVEEIQTLFITRQPYKSKINETLTSSIHVVHLSSEYLQSSTDKSSSTLLPDKIQAIKLQIENFKPEKFSPLGLSASISSKNHVLLYVINDFDSYFGQTIEVFKYLQKDEKLIHLKTIKNRDFQSLIDVKVVADGGDRFFAVNNFYFKNPYLQKLEILSQWKSGNLIFFDGKKSTIIDRFEGYFIF